MGVRRLPHPIRSPLLHQAGRLHLLDQGIVVMVPEVVRVIPPTNPAQTVARVVQIILKPLPEARLLRRLPFPLIHLKQTMDPALVLLLDLEVPTQARVQTPHLQALHLQHLGRVILDQIQRQRQIQQHHLRRHAIPVQDLTRVPKLQVPQQALEIPELGTVGHRLMGLRIAIRAAQEIAGKVVRTMGKPITLPAGVVYPLLVLFTTDRYMSVNYVQLDGG